MTERNLDFDAVIDRRNTKCLKYDFAKKRGYPEDVLPMWVADMDFRTSSYIEDALADLERHNIYGYTNVQDGDGFFEAVAGWMKRHHGWKVQPEWHVKTPATRWITRILRGGFPEGMSNYSFFAIPTIRWGGPGPRRSSAASANCADGTV